MTLQHMTSAPPMSEAWLHGGPLVLEARAPGPFLNLNDRMHWAPQARLIETWRFWAKIVGRSYGSPKLLRRGPSIVTVELPVPDKRRRDPHNYIATVKPIIDGLVDAGLWPDDTPEWVSVAEPRLIVRRDHLVRILIDPRPPTTPKEKP